MRPIIPFFACAAAFFTGCESTSKTPAPRNELVGGPCRYEETLAIATVSDADASQVRFLINGEISPHERTDLPAQFNYRPGSRFRVIEKHITEGTCTPYLLEVVGPAQIDERTTTFRFPDPSLQ